MATTTASPTLDEIVHRRPEMIQWWLDPEQYKPGVEPPHTYMEERFIHRYFSESPFFDPTTKNGLLFGQSAVNFETYAIVHDAAKLEGALRNRPGMEYVIAEKPQQVPSYEQKPAQPSGVWVLRKQQRLEDQTGATRDSPYPNTETRGTYYIVNESVYQAPSVADVVENRILSAVTSLEKMFEKTASLPSFTPTTGHTYLPPRMTATATAPAGAYTQASLSRSREGSLAPGTSADTQSLRSGSLAPELSTAASHTTDTDIQTARILIDSLQKSLQFSDEYMDENPLVGEPGNFRFTSSAAAVKKRKADEEAALLTAQKAKEAKETSSTAASPKIVKAATPPPVFTEARATAKTDRDRREEKKRRRKSRPGVGGNTTPSTPKGMGYAITPAGAG